MLNKVDGQTTDRIIAGEGTGGRQSVGTMALPSRVEKAMFRKIQ